MKDRLRIIHKLEYREGTPLSNMLQVLLLRFKIMHQNLDSIVDGKPKIKIEQVGRVWTNDLVYELVTTLEWELKDLVSEIEADLHQLQQELTDGE